MSASRSGSWLRSCSAISLPVDPDVDWATMDARSSNSRAGGRPRARSNRDVFQSMISKPSRRRVLHLVGSARPNLDVGAGVVERQQRANHRVRARPGRKPRKSRASPSPCRDNQDLRPVLGEGQGAVQVEHDERGLSPA
jgi:hypothetical protein